MLKFQHKLGAAPRPVKLAPAGVCGAVDGAAGPAPDPPGAAPSGGPGSPAPGALSGNFRIGGEPLSCGRQVTSSVNDYVAGLASAVALLRRSPSPGDAQKDALRALVALAAERSATIRYYDGQLMVDTEAISTAEPRMAAFAERLEAQNLAELSIAKRAGPDELLALSLGLAANPGDGRLKERLRDAGSVRVMVVLQQHDRRPRSISEAFEKVKFDEQVMAEWNHFVEQGILSERDRIQFDTREGARADALAALALPSPEQATPPPGAAGPPGDEAPSGRNSALDESASAAGWMAAFERAIEMRFPDHFADADWAYLLDREAGTLRAGDRAGRTSVSVTLPAGYLGQSSWLLAGRVLVELRRLAERQGAVKKRR